MKRKNCVLMIIVFGILFLTACSGEKTFQIKMPYENDFYETNGWTLDETVKHFEELGFTNIVTKKCITDEYVYNVIQTVRIDGDLFGFEENEEYNNHDEVVINYYEPTPTLTIENCDDLKRFLFTNDVKYTYMAGQYDGQFIEFDGYIAVSEDFFGGTSHLIHVGGGDTVQNEGCLIHIDIMTTDYERRLNINENVKEGQQVKFIGKINEEMSHYYKMLHVDCYYMLGR